LKFRIALSATKLVVRNMKFKNILIFLVTAPAWKVLSLIMLPVFLFIIVPYALSKALLILGTLTVFLWLYSVGVLLYEKYSQYLNISLFLV
jgi:hypothetical protein